MLKRNLRIRQALVGAVTDVKLAKEVKANIDVRNQVLEVGESCFWSDTARVADVLKRIATAIAFCEGDHVPVSVMPHIWAHVASELNPATLGQAGFDEENHPNRRKGLLEAKHEPAASDTGCVGSGSALSRRAALR